MGMTNYEPICVNIIPTVLTDSISKVLYVPTSLSVTESSRGQSLLGCAIFLNGNLSEIRGPFYQHGLDLIPEWKGNHMAIKVCIEIIYPSLCK